MSLSQILKYVLKYIARKKSFSELLNVHQNKRFYQCPVSLSSSRRLLLCEPLQCLTISDDSCSVIILITLFSLLTIID